MSNSDNKINYSDYRIGTTWWVIFSISIFICIIILGFIHNSNMEDKGIPYFVVIFIIFILMGYTLYKYLDNKSQYEEDVKQQELEANAYCKKNPGVCMHNGTCQSIG